MIFRLCGRTLCCGSSMPPDPIRDPSSRMHQASAPRCWWRTTSNWRHTSRAGRLQLTTPLAQSALPPRRSDRRLPTLAVMSTPKPILQRRLDWASVRQPARLSIMNVVASAAIELITATQWHNADGDQLAVTASGRRIVLPAEALGADLRHAQLGQRLHSVEADGRVLSAWL